MDIRLDYKRALVTGGSSGIGEAIALGLADAGAKVAINCHTHLYSTLARGITLPGKAPKNFPEILKKLWWRLDRALDRDAIRLSALLTLADCIRWGCTTVFDHHASPSCIAGSLDAIADDAIGFLPPGSHVCQQIMLRGVPLLR